MSAQTPLVVEEEELSNIHRQRRVTLAAVAAALGISLGLASLLVSGLRRTASNSDLLLKPAVVGWIQEAAQGPAEQTAKTPAPPAHESWSSPLLKQCPVADGALRQRLMAMPLQVSSIKADPSNYAPRVHLDAKGQRVDPQPAVIVLHETVYSLESAVNSFTTPHLSDNDQASYHTLVGLNGEIVQVVDPKMRAYGAGNSAFDGRWVFTSPNFSGSVNNFALHVSLETPPDGVNATPGHSGYTAAQYDALSRVVADWMARFHIKPEAITTHRFIDMGGERADPRSFAWDELQLRLTALGLLC
jgi:N-acetyl-anhydromuramyl-L-alanine amidase AmpD